MCTSINSKPNPKLVQTADLYCAFGVGTDALPIHPVKSMPLQRQDAPSNPTPSKGTIPSRNTTRDLIDQITSQLLIYKFGSNVKTNAMIKVEQTPMNKPLLK